MRTLIALTFLALALPVAASAGGFATAGLAPPAGIDTGETWRAELTLLQHGRTPLDGVQPTITISGPETRTYEFAPTGTPGIYSADVVFPVAGTWRYTVDDGFSQVHTFAPVRIGAPAGSPAGGGFGFPLWTLAPVGGLLAAGLAVALVRRRAAGVPALR